MMSTQAKRTTVYLDPDLHKALRLKAVAVSRSVSDLINEAVRESLKKEKNKYRFIMEIMSKQGLQISKTKKL
jgi:predicted transcriptional regulator